MLKYSKCNINAPISKHKTTLQNLLVTCLTNLKDEKFKHMITLLEYGADPNLVDQRGFCPMKLVLRRDLYSPNYFKLLC